MERLCLSDEQPLGQRLKHLVGNSLHSDFTFVIEDDNVEIPAHKLIIAAASPVLDRIVYGTDTFSAKDNTKVDGTSKESFMEILRYIYTDEININDDNVFDIFNKANYYGLSVIETKCSEYLKDNLTSTTVTWIYHQLFHLFRSSELLKNCLRVIQLDPISCFTAEEFSKLSIDEFKLILELETINCSEIDLFMAMVKLATSHCVTLNLEPTGQNKRTVLNGAENLLRLETLTKCELQTCIDKQLDFFSATELERFYAIIGNKLSTTVVKRNRYTFNDAVWLSIEDQHELPPSCFYAGSSLFICRSIPDYKGQENRILPFTFHPSGHLHDRRSVSSIDILCGSGYEWRESCGVIPQDTFTFHPSGHLHDRRSVSSIDILCGSGYEWRESCGVIPQDAVAITQNDGKELFIGRGTNYWSGELTIGYTYNGAIMYVTEDPMFEVDDEEELEEKEKISDFEILVAVNVKNSYKGDFSAPPDSIFLGLNENNFKTYLGKAWHRNDLLPAKVILEENASYVSYGMAEIRNLNFEFVRLDEGTYKWEKATDGEVPWNAIDGGCTETGETLYFGRVLRDGVYIPGKGNNRIYIPGKVHPSHKVFYAPYKGEELSFRSYEVLVKF